jgi:lauroyl/myristoyl acyltransferase
VVGAVLRVNRRFWVQVNPPIFPDRTRPKEEEVLRITREWSRQIEQLVREHPEQWPWFHDRWRTTPDSLAARDRRTLQLGGGSERLRRSAPRTGQPA